MESVVEGGDEGDGEMESVVEGGDEGDGEMESVVEGGDEGDGEMESVVEGGDEGDDDGWCILCGLTEDDEEDEVWIECTKCLQWVHKSCLPPHHPHDADDDDLLCTDCTTKKPKCMFTLSH